VIAASARGVAERWIFLRYVVRPAWAPLIALAGVSVSIAFGAAIPVEVICDLPGLGQLAWKAALARDLPVLVSLTLIVTAITLAANAVADVALEAART
jgi:peptide/nickel transport system permease protein